MAAVMLGRPERAVRRMQQRGELMACVGPRGRLLFRLDEVGELAERLHAA